VVVATRDEYNNDQLTVRISTIHGHHDVLEKTSHKFQSILRVLPTVIVEEHKTITALQLNEVVRKPVRFVDLRK